MDYIDNSHAKWIALDDEIIGLDSEDQYNLLLEFFKNNESRQKLVIFKN